MRRNIEYDFREASIFPVAGGLQLSIDGLGATDLIQVCIVYGDESLTFDYESVDSIRLRLSRE